MMNDVSTLQPSGVWKHFAALSAIPRVSGHEQAAAAYVAGVGTSHGWKVRQDPTGNVLLVKNASPGRESKAGVVLQAHLDMVGQKVADSAHDFLKDPLRLRLAEGWVSADGTTLGADNGIGVALALAMLEDATLEHGPLAALFTVDEEVGLKGAANVKADFLPGQLLINLDADREDELIIGCAGSATVKIECPVERTPCDPNAVTLQIKVDGLRGGHSGADIHLGRGNANRLMARLLATVGVGEKSRLVQWNGGTARNAIPRISLARIVLPANQEQSARTALQEATEEIRNELRAADPDFSVAIETVAPCAEALSESDSRKCVDLVRLIPNGPLQFCSLSEAAVETSNNVAIVELAQASDFRIQCLARSLIDSANRDVVAVIQGAARLAGGRCVVEGAYPGWQPADESTLVQLIKEVASRQLGRPAKTVVVHGGLECGLLRAVCPDLQCVAVGPRIEAMHSPDERLEIDSVGRVHSILREVITRV